jgi:hypothetical protein
MPWRKRRYGFNNHSVLNERLVALFLLGALFFSPIFIRLFGSGGTIFGLPLLYVYIFAAWGLIIGLVALAAEKSKGSGPPSGEGI